MTERQQIVLNAVLRALRPLVRLLLRHGVNYPAFGAALKQEFLRAAQAELAQRHVRQTDSALTLLSGVHRRDVRTLLRAAPGTRGPAREPGGLPALVIARWLSGRNYRTRTGAPRTLPRAGRVSFDALVESITRDVRPRAVLEELKRLGAVHENDAGIALVAEGFAPRRGFDAMAAAMAVNLADHAAAAALNLDGARNFLEQAVFVDEVTEASCAELQKTAVSAWKKAMRRVLAESQRRVDSDAAHAPAAQRMHRARFGVYYFSEAEEPGP